MPATISIYETFGLNEKRTMLCLNIAVRKIPQCSLDFVGAKMAYPRIWNKMRRRSRSMIQKKKKNIKMLSRYKIGGSNCEKSFQPLTPQIGPTLKRRQATSVERSI